MSNITELSISQLKKVISLKERLAELESELAALIGSAKAEPAPKKKGMSAKGRKAVSTAQRKRWAKIKGAVKASPANPAPVAKPAKKKFTMSASAKAAISKAAKARWAKIKAAKKA